MKKHWITGLAIATLMSTAANAAPVEPKPAGDASPAMVVDTPSFVSTVMGANAFEIKSSELANQKSHSAEIKDVADMIIADHTAAESKLEELLGDAKPTEKPALPPKLQKMLDQLTAAEGKDFDMLYVDMQSQAHMEAIALFRTYAGSGDNQTLVGFAKETLPKLETHAGHVQMLVDAAL
jgi:putative membrane protein